MSKANRYGQRLATGEVAAFTHVAICMVPDVLIDSRPFVGVQLRSVFEEVRNGHFGPSAMTDALVLRHPALASDYDAMDSTGEHLLKPLYRQLFKKYNWLFTRPQASDTDPNAAETRRVFCSELCVLMLKSVDQAVGNILPQAAGQASATFPVDFHGLLNKGWLDVTSDWLTEFESIRSALSDPSSNHGRLVLPREQTAKQWIEETEGWARLQDATAALTEQLTVEFDNLLERAQKSLSA